MDDGTKIQLIQLRNPWAHTEWTGPWSDGCDQWDANPKMKARIHEKRSLAERVGEGLALQNNTKFNTFAASYFSVFYVDKYLSTFSQEMMGSFGCRFKTGPSGSPSSSPSQLN